ncbi:TetR/AcrR family transcriptional regulator [Polaromonas sp.]|uniref:TetR/AcrR family transcriptional regulator n=2 Tax=Polaromonas sp. TaxID=1869339 RepID=UPI0027332CA7|nr:TetR/AcrR family transcriptional regulator [Polaromonas sp.]
MSPARGRPRSEAKNAEMLWAAAQLLAVRGVAQTSTRDIAALAQTTERTLFKHFGSKDGLVRAVLEEAVLVHLAPLSLQALTRAIDGCQGDVQAWHQELLTSRLLAWQGAPELTRLLLVELLRDASLRERFTAQWLPAAWAPLTALFAQLQGNGKLRADLPPDRLARLFLSLNLGFLVTRTMFAAGLAWDDAAEVSAIAALFGAGSQALLHEAPRARQGLARSGTMDRIPQKRKAPP